VRVVLSVAALLALLLAAPATASADVIFDPADAEDLAAVLAEAHKEQGVCYGWQVTVSDPYSGTSESVGSNFGAGEPIPSSNCTKTVRFTADITYTSESSEAEDSASYDVTSNPYGVTRADLDDLGIDFGGLTGEDPDVAIGNAVTALPLLAADKGLAKPLSAAPATGEAPADAQLTDNPGSDWWRNSGGMVIWALIVLAAGAVFAWFVLWSHRRQRRRYAAATPTYVPDTPESIFDPNVAPGEKAPEPPTEELPVQEPQAEKPASAPPQRDGGTEQARPAPSDDQKDKE
jgi:hypothetical protein